MKALAVSLALALPLDAAAENTRMDRLDGHNMVQKLTKDGRWSVTFTENSARYTCLTCSGKTTAQITVRPVDKATVINFTALYLEERKAFCAKLAVDASGRCLGTQSVSFRPSSQKGAY